MRALPRTAQQMTTLSRTTLSRTALATTALATTALARTAPARTASVMTALLLLAACASSADPGNMGDQPGIGVAEAALHSGAAPLAMRIDDGILAKDPHNVAALI